MKFRTGVSILLSLIAASVYWYQPWPFDVIMTSMTWIGIVFYVSLMTGAVVLLWSTLPQRFIDPTGKAVFITGCDSGFGNELARLLDARGFHVFAGCLAPDRGGAKSLEETTSDRLKVLPIDVTDDFQVQKAVEFVQGNLGDNELWAVVNNAGVAAFCEIEWSSVQEYMKIMDVNVFGIVRVTKGFLPLLRQSEGRVINVASLAGRYSLPYFSAYTMSKKACIAFSDCLRQEMRKFNITVITVEPGLYKTPINTLDNLIETNKKSWAETPTHVKQDYGEEYFHDFLQLVTRSVATARTNVREVVDNMVHSVCAEHPHVRYVPYWKFRVRAFILGNLPSAASDKLFAMRFRTVEPEIKKNSPKTPKTPKLTSRTFKF